jgi:AcrR family transcriptional regulator
MTEAVKQPLNRGRIVATAIDVADREGLDSVSMRTLATRLDAGTMSLYNHVRNKDDLLDAMVEHVASEIEPPSGDANWKDGVREIAISTRTALRRHPWVVEIWSARVPGPNRWMLMDEVLRQLASAGLPEDVADLAFHAILNHVLGHTRQELAANTQTSSPDLDTMAEALDAEGFTRVGQHLRYHKEDHPTHDSFLFVLDLILHGLDKQTTRSKPTESSPTPAANPNASTPARPGQ